MKFTGFKGACRVAVAWLVVWGCSVVAPVEPEAPKALPKKCEDNEEIEIGANMFIDIPGGRFRMGLEEELAENILKDQGWLGQSIMWELPAHEVEVAPFQIGRTPVTNAEYAEFVAAGGYGKIEFWEAMSEDEPEEAWERSDFEEWVGQFTDATNKHLGPTTWRDGKPPPGKETHPVSGVSWYEAVAYCAFRGGRLPREVEWEFAARGTDGRIYPWGNEFDPCRCANSARNGSDTVPVGSMLDGQSPFGVLHMVGNVAEWTRDWFAPYPGKELGAWYEERKHRFEHKVMTRSTFGGFAEILRASYRIEHEPENRFPGLGFRCARDVKP